MGLPSKPTLLIEPPPIGVHGYFDRVRARPELWRSYSLRDQAQLNRYSGGSSDSITFDPANDTYPLKQDAAKVLLPADKVSIPSQVRVPIDVKDGSALITWDVWWGPEFASKALRSTLNTHKCFMVASPVDNSQRWLEIRTLYSLGGNGSIVGGIDARCYPPAGGIGPGTWIGGGSRVMPLKTMFLIQARTWTRYWVLVELSQTDFSMVSLWVADETRDAVQLYDRVAIRSAGNLTNLWFEYNSSQNDRLGPPLTGYVRNQATLRAVGDVPALLLRP